MVHRSFLLNLSGVLIFVSAALHVFSVIIGGLHLLPIFLVPFGIFYLYWGITFLEGSAGNVMLALCVMFGGALGAYLLTFVHWSVPEWWLMLIVWTDIAVAATLFVYLIRG